MKKSFKLVSLFSVSVALVAGAMTITNNQKVDASVTTRIILKNAKASGYTKANVLKANTGKLNRSAKNKLVKGSMAGMKENDSFTDTNSADNREVTVTNLSTDDQTEISKYALAVINSARTQMGKKKWTYSRRAMRFASVVALNYNKDNMSVWDATHDVAGIKRAARTCGLNSKAGQVYEDESGLPISSDWNENKRPIKVLKEQIYFNIKQMLFGGYYGNDVNNASAYTEWEHAGDLLGLRSAKGYDAKTKEFGVSFSSLDGKHISVHMLGVAKRYIQNYKKFHK